MTDILNYWKTYNWKKSLIVPAMTLCALLFGFVMGVIEAPEASAYFTDYAGIAAVLSATIAWIMWLVHLFFGFMYYLWFNVIMVDIFGSKKDKP